MGAALEMLSYLTDEQRLRQNIRRASHGRVRMWNYEQDTGRMDDPTGALAGKGYAGGNEGANPEGVNNHDMQSVHGVGPLPCGVYTMGTPVPQSHLGPFAIPLIPDPGNEMFGRSDFYCHGDTTPSGRASKGCVIMPRAVRETMWASADHKIRVQVSA